MALTVGMIGCGGISRFHFEGLEQVKARVKWVCDLSEDAARPWAAKFGATYTADYLALVNDPEIGLIIITTISSNHKERLSSAKKRLPRTATMRWRLSAPPSGRERYSTRRT